LKILEILNNPINCPIEIHCQAGMGRTGSVMALLLFAYYKMDMNRAIQFANAHGGAINSQQYPYLFAFARDHQKIVPGRGCGIK
jgi:protein-tyrosine phosphatase